MKYFYKEPFHIFTTSGDVKHLKGKPATPFLSKYHYTSLNPFMNSVFMPKFIRFCIMSFVASLWSIKLWFLSFDLKYGNKENWVQDLG